MKNVNINYANIMVILDGEALTLKECAKKYNLDFKLLLSEFIDSGNINTALKNAISKNNYLEKTRHIIYHLSINELDDLFKNINKNLNDMNEIENDVLSYIVNTKEEKVILTKKDLISLINNNNDITNPIIRDEKKEKIDRIIEFISESESNEIELSKEEVIELLEIIKNYKIPFSTIGPIIYKSLVKNNKNTKDNKMYCNEENKVYYNEEKTHEEDKEEYIQNNKEYVKKYIIN